MLENAAFFFLHLTLIRLHKFLRVTAVFDNKSRQFVINQRFLKPLHLHHTDEALTGTAMKQKMRLHNKHAVPSVNLY